jgi:trigonelline permease
MVNANDGDSHADGLTPAGKATLVEGETVRHVPEDERTGKPWHLFTLWFGSNCAPLTIATGVLGPVVYHLPIGWTILALIIGNAIGAIFMALHSVQGSRLGVPQMIQTRAQFGSKGALLILAIVIVMFFGYLSSEVVVAGEALTQAIPSLPVDWGIVISGVLALSIVAVGYHVIHAVNRILLPAFLVAAALTLIWILFVHGVHGGTSGRFTAGGFLATVAAPAIWQLSYAPFVADYSRYLPEDTKPARVFWSTYAGAAIGSIALMIVGALVGYLTTGANPVGDVKALTGGGVGEAVVVIFFLGGIDMAVFGLYSPTLSIITSIQTFREQWLPRRNTRIVVATVFAAVAAFVAIKYQNSFLVVYSNFLAFVFYVLIPWSVINLMDFYVRREGDYDIAALFQSNGGRYGAVRWPTIGAYVVGVAVQVPFMSTAYFTGPVAHALGGGDIAWIVGGLVTIPLFLMACRAEQALAMREGKRIEEEGPSLATAADTRAVEEETPIW